MAFNLFKRKNIPSDGNVSSLAIDPSVPTELNFGQLQALGWQRTANTDGKSGPVVNFSKGGSVISVDPTGSAMYSLGANRVGNGPSMEHLTITDPQTIFSAGDITFAKNYDSQTNLSASSSSPQQSQFTNSHATGSMAPNVIKPTMLGESPMEISQPTEEVTPKVVPTISSSEYLKVAPTVTDPADIVSHSQKQAFEGTALHASVPNFSTPRQAQMADASEAKFSEVNLTAGGTAQVSPTGSVIDYRVDENGGNGSHSTMSESTNTNTASLKATPAVTDPADVVSHSQKQTFENLSAVSTNSSPTTPQDQYAVKHTLDQLDNTDGIVVGGGTSNLTSSQSAEDLVGKNHAIALEQENKFALKSAEDKINTDLKQVASDNSSDIMSNAQKSTFRNLSATPASTPTTTTQEYSVAHTLAESDKTDGIVVGGGTEVPSTTNGFLRSTPAPAADLHSTLHDSFTLPVGTPDTVPVPPVTGLNPDLGKSTPHTGARYGNDF